MLIRSSGLCLALALLFAGCTGSNDDDGDDSITPVMDAGMNPVDSGPMLPECTNNSECSGATPFCNADGDCAEPPVGGLIGWGDGTAASVTIEKIAESYQARQAVDLEFNTERPNELWVLHRRERSNERCDSQVQTQAGCASLEGSVMIITDPGTPAQTEQVKVDGNAWHFMRRPPALAFGPDGFFGTCGEERTGNFLDSAADFIGPSLWDSDPAIFAITPPGGNGSHMDMLHGTPFCTGMAHEADNIYWTVNGSVGSLDRYNFNLDHGPGADDHSDGELYRYAVGLLTRVPDVPSHIVYLDGWVYAADTGAGRIVKLDATSGDRIGPVNPVYEPLRDHAVFGSTTVMDVVPPGTLQQPSGMEIHDGVIYVSDHATSQIHAFDMEGNLLRSLQTELPANSIAGMTISPDGVLYFVNLTNADVFRILPN